MTTILLAMLTASPSSTLDHSWFQYTGEGYPTVVSELKRDLIPEATKENHTTSPISVPSGSKSLSKPNDVHGDNRSPGPPWEYPFTPYQPNETIELSAYWPQEITEIPGLHTYSAYADWDRTWGDDKWGCYNHPLDGPYERSADRYSWNDLYEVLIDNGSPF